MLWRHFATGFARIRFHSEFVVTCFISHAGGHVENGRRSEHVEKQNGDDMLKKLEANKWAERRRSVCAFVWEFKLGKKSTRNCHISIYLVKNSLSRKSLTVSRKWRRRGRRNAALRGPHYDLNFAHKLYSHFRHTIARILLYFSSNKKKVRNCTCNRRCVFLLISVLTYLGTV